MNAVSKVSPAHDDNVIPVDFRTATPVEVDYHVASTPKSDIAKRLAAEAAAHTAKLETSTSKKAGTLRILADGRSDMFHLNPYNVEMEDDLNCRELQDPENLAHIDWLARSIAKRGVETPMIVKLEGGKAILTDGHMRLFGVFRAIEVYGHVIKTVPLIAESRNSEPQDHIVRQLLSGKPKTVIEQGRAFIKLQKHGWQTHQIADELQIGEARVKEILAFMAESGPVIKEMVILGKVAATEAEKALRLTGGDAKAAEKTLTAALDLAASEGKTKATGRHVKKVTADMAGATTKPTLFSQLRSIHAQPTSSVDNSGDFVQITMSKADWREYARLLKI
jgi:hypothetical protein